MLCNSAADFLSKTNKLDSLLIVTPIVGFCNCSMFCCALLCVHSSFAIISMGIRELFAFLCLPSWKNGNYSKSHELLYVLVMFFLMQNNSFTDKINVENLSF